MAHTSRLVRRRRDSAESTTPATAGHATVRRDRRRHGSAGEVASAAPGHVTPRPRRHRRTLVATLAVALVTLPPSVTHSAASLPDDVADWFAHSAAATVSAQTRGEVDGAGDAPDDAVVAVTEPRPLYQWSAEFRTGEPTDEPVAAVGEWVAAFTSDGRPAGVVVAWRYEGEVELAYAEEDAGLAATVSELPAAALVVHEPMLGAHFAVDDGTVQTLRASLFPATGPLPLEDFQPVLAQQLAEMSVADEPGTGSRWWMPVTWVGLGGLVSVGLVLALAAARRRTGPGHT